MVFSWCEDNQWGELEKSFEAGSAGCSILNKIFQQEWVPPSSRHEVNCRSGSSGRGELKDSKVAMCQYGVRLLPLDQKQGTLVFVMV